MNLSDKFSQVVLEKFLVRKNGFGCYGDAPFTSDKPLTDKLLKDHLWNIGLKIGVHPSDGTKCNFSVFDIDNHDNKPEIRELNLQKMLTLKSRLEALGFHCVLEDSDGQGGLHLWLLWASPVPHDMAVAFGRGVVSDIDTGIESFPKLQVSAKDYPGGWVRLPGQHWRRRQHTSKFLVDGKWTDDINV